MTSFDSNCSNRMLKQLYILLILILCTRRKPPKSTAKYFSVPTNTNPPTTAELIHKIRLRLTATMRLGLRLNRRITLNLEVASTSPLATPTQTNNSFLQRTSLKTNKHIQISIQTREVARKFHLISNNKKPARDHTSSNVIHKSSRTLRGPHSSIGRKTPTSSSIKMRKTCILPKKYGRNHQNVERRQPRSTTNSTNNKRRIIINLSSPLAWARRTSLRSATATPTTWTTCLA